MCGEKSADTTLKLKNEWKFTATLVEVYPEESCSK